MIICIFLNYSDELSQSLSFAGNNHFVIVSRLRLMNFQLNSQEILLYHQLLSDKIICILVYIVLQILRDQVIINLYVLFNIRIVFSILKHVGRVVWVSTKHFLYFLNHILTFDFRDVAIIEYIPFLVFETFDISIIMATHSTALVN